MNTFVLRTFTPSRLGRFRGSASRLVARAHRALAETGPPPRPAALRRGSGVFACLLFGVTALADSGEELFKKVDPAVVAIQHERAGGSGFIVDKRGYILTNGHVVSMMDREDPTATAKRITVILNNERKYQAKVIGFSLDPDVALLKIEPEASLPVVRIADSKRVKPGQTCYAFGMPLGLKRTLTKGIISNNERTDLGTFTKVFQTDAAINPGNSGGPLFNEHGEVIGINTYGAMFAQNLGFTIPIDVAKVMEQYFLKYGRWVRATLPFFLTKAMTEEFATTLGTPQGIFIDFVEPGSLAERAGLSNGDVIIELDGKPVSGKTEAELSDFKWELVTREVGSTVAMTVLHPVEQETYERRVIRATLVEDEPAVRVGRQMGEIIEIRYDDLGVGVQQLTTLGRYTFNILVENGVRVTTIMRAKPAAAAGLLMNDIIVAVNEKPILQPAQFERRMDEQLMAQTPYIVFTVHRGHDIKKVVLKPRYDLKDRKIAIVAKANTEYVETMKRRLSLRGGQVTVMENPDRFNPNEFDAILLASLPEANQKLTQALKTLAKERKIIGAIGKAPLFLLDAGEEFRSKKMTMDKGVSAAALEKKSNYTGADVEVDEFVVTSTGFDLKTVKAFLNAFARKISKKG